MKLAVAVQGKRICKHFDDCEFFVLYDIIDGRVKGKVMIDASICRGEDALLYILENEGAEVLLCGQMRPETKSYLDQVEIKVFPNISGPIDAIVKKYMRQFTSKK